MVVLIFRSVWRHQPLIRSKAVRQLRTLALGSCRIKRRAGKLTLRNLRKISLRVRQSHRECACVVVLVVVEVSVTILQEIYTKRHRHGKIDPRSASSERNVLKRRITGCQLEIWNNPRSRAGLMLIPIALQKGAFVSCRQRRLSYPFLLSLAWISCSLPARESRELNQVACLSRCRQGKLLLFVS